MPSSPGETRPLLVTAAGSSDYNISTLADAAAAAANRRRRGEEGGDDYYENGNVLYVSEDPAERARRMRMERNNTFWTLGCIYGAAAVGFGAFGAHGLKKVVSDPARVANFATAAHYQLVHSVALLVASQAAPDNKVAGGLFTAGMTMFSGSIYALVLDPARFRFLGPVTPLGGLCLIGGWIALAFN